MKYFLLINFFLFSLPSFGFTLSNSVAASYSMDEPIKVYVADQTCHNIGITHRALLDIAVSAINQYWNTVPSAHLFLESGGIKNVASAFSTQAMCTNSGANCTINQTLVVDTGILIVCNSNTTDFSASNGVLGLTVANNISGRTIKGALIMINDTVTNGFVNKTNSEQTSIIAHEIGHAIGLGHSSIQDSLMYYQSYQTRTALGWDDIDGASMLYPKKQPFSACLSTAASQGPIQKNILFTFLFALLFALLLFPKKLSLSFFKNFSTAGDLQRVRKK